MLYKNGVFKNLVISYVTSSYFYFKQRTCTFRIICNQTAIRWFPLLVRHHTKENITNVFFFLSKYHKFKARRKFKKKIFFIPQRMRKFWKIDVYIFYTILI